MEGMNHSGNIRFHYLYRDAGNYKLFNSYTFSNREGRRIDEVEHIIRQKLCFGELFHPAPWALEPLRFPEYCTGLDHDWHEFEFVEATHEPPTDARDISEFLRQVEATDPQLWYKNELHGLT